MKVKPPNNHIIELTKTILKQNEIILKMNQALLKVVSEPIYIPTKQDVLYRTEYNHKGGRHD